MISYRFSGPIDLAWIAREVRSIGDVVRQEFDREAWTYRRWDDDTVDIRALCRRWDDEINGR